MTLKQLLACVALFSSYSAFSQDCTKFAVLDHYSSDTNYKSYERVKDVLCSQEIKESSSARSAGISAGIPLPILDDVFSLNFSGNFASNDWSKWQSGFCHSNYYETATQLKNSSISEVFSSNAASVVKQCLDREPVYGYFDVVPDGTAFSFIFSAQGKEKLKRATLKSATSVSDCNPSNPFNVSVLDQYITDLDMSGQKKSFGCHWDSSKTVFLTINLANQGDRTYLLPSIVKRTTQPPPPPKPVAVLIPSTEVIRVPGISGNGHDFGPTYPVCTPDKPAGWTIQALYFHLEGDRQCGSFANCAASASNNAIKACYTFNTQGHDDAKPGMRQSDGVLTVVWQHTELITPK